MTNTVVVRYETRADAAQENQRLVERVFAQLDRERPEGLGYAVFRLADGAGFLHVVATDEGGASLSELPAFMEFQHGAEERLDGPPTRSEASLVGSYGSLTGGSGERAAVQAAVAFVEAFGRRDMAAVSGALAEDVVFESPRTRITGAAAVAAAISEFAQAVTGVTVIDAFGDHERAVVMYDMHTGPFGTLRAVDRVLVRDGKIVSDSLVFDTRALGQ